MAWFAALELGIGTGKLFMAAITGSVCIRRMVGHIYAHGIPLPGSSEAMATFTCA